MTKDILDKAKELERDIESLRILIKEKESGDGLCDWMKQKKSEYEKELEAL